MTNDKNKPIDENWAIRFAKINSYGKTKVKEIKIQLKDLWSFVNYVFRNRKDIYETIKKAQKQEQHILSVAKYITEQNEMNLRNRKKTLAEEDEMLLEKLNPYRLVGTMDRNFVEKFAGDALELAEKKKGDRIKMSELRE